MNKFELAVCINNDNKNVTPIQTIDAIYKAGFKNVFIQWYNKDTQSQNEQIKYLKQLGLNIVFAHLGYLNTASLWLDDKKGEDTVYEYINDITTLNNYGIKLFVMHISSSKKPNYNKLGLERFKKIIEHAKKLNCKIAFENTRHKQDLDYLFSNIKDENIGLCFDSGHFHCHFKDDYNLVIFKDKVLAVHLHDNDSLSDQHLLPFDGSIDWDKVVNILSSLNYQSYLTLELCYKDQYLKYNILEFYKLAYLKGNLLKNRFENINFYNKKL